MYFFFFFHFFNSVQILGLARTFTELVAGRGGFCVCAVFSETEHGQLTELCPHAFFLLNHSTPNYHVEPENGFLNGCG